MVTWAQQDRGTFTGTVTDPTGSVMPSVSIRIQNIETNAVYDSRTNEVGQYRVPNLPVGSYRITFEAQGFKAAVRDGLTLNVAQVARIDVQLQVGATTESVEVTAETPLLQTETPEVGLVLTNRNVIDLPLGFSGGRYAENFAYKLTPGVAGNNWESRINGAPAFTKEVVLDGVSATIYISGSFVEASPSMEALEEFKVQTSGMSAEFGRTGGGIFNFVMRSGSNDWHGSAMGQIHNEWADANTFANNFYGRPKRLDRRHNFAFSGGGPVTLPKIYSGKDRSFFYAAYERYKESFGGGGSPGVTVPLSEWWDGDLSRYLTTQVLGQDALGRNVLRGAIYDPGTTRLEGGRLVREVFPGNIIPRSRISRVSQNLAALMKKHYLPQVREPNGQLALINNTFFPISNQAGFTQNQFSAKGDHYVSAAHKLSGSFVYVDRPRNLLDQGGVWDFTDPEGGPLSRARLQHVRSWYGRLAHDWTITPTVLNHFTAGYNRQRNPSQSKHLDEPGAQVLGIRGIDQAKNYPEINITGGDRVNFPMLGYQANDFGAGQTYEYIDTLSWMKGRHSLRFGVDYRKNYLSWRNNAGPGRFNFGQDVTGLPGFNQTGHPFASMLLGLVNSASVTMDTPTTSVFTNLALFVQDDFKVSSKLTLNLGLRWDYQPQGVEKYDRLHNFTPGVIDPVTGLPGAVEFAGQGTGRTGKRNFYSNQYNDFAPRVGLAYQVTSKLVTRAGYGIFYHGRNPNGWSGVPWGNKAGFQQTNVVNQPTPNTPAFSWDSGYPGVVMDVPRDPSLANYLWGPVSWDPEGGRVGHTQQWNLNFQYELPGSMVFDLGYVGSKSTGTQANELRQILQLRPEVLVLGDVLGQWVDRQEAIPPAAAAMGARYPFKTPGTFIPIQQTLQPFPQVPYWSAIYSWNSPLGFGTYNALQVQLNKRFTHGLQFVSNYTFSKSIDNLNSAFGDTWGMNSGRPLDYYNLRLDKSISQFDRTHWVKIGASYDLPFGRGRPFGGQMNRAVDFAAGGWTLQYIGNYSSGEPLGLGGTGTPNFNATTNRALIVNPDGRSLRLGVDESQFDMSRISTAGTAQHRYIDTSLVKDPPRYTRGNASFRVSQLRGFAFYGDDFALQKNFKPAEGVRVQFRAEFLNLFNRHRFSGINTSAASPLFGQITSVSDDRRQIQFGIRADW
jgi:hypothetical protein